MIKITEDLIKQGLSDRGALNGKQMKILGYDVSTGWPRRGWKRRVIGKYLTKNAAQEFLWLKNAHLKKQETGYRFNKEHPKPPSVKPSKQGSRKEQSRRRKTFLALPESMQLEDVIWELHKLEMPAIADMLQESIGEI